jgi:hypothetical protein
MQTRRTAITLLLAPALGGLSTFLPDEAAAGPRGRKAARRSVRRKTRRRVRRRIRRRAVRRTVKGRKLVVVPMAVAAGWELELEGQVVVVQEVSTKQVDGSTVDVIVVKDSSGKVATHYVLKEDNADNQASLQGSELSADDTSTPSVESEE